MFSDLKNLLKKINFIYNINSILRARIYNVEYKIYSFYYNIYARLTGKFYTESSAIKIFKTNITNRLKSQNWINLNSAPAVFWVGASYDQDYSGFLQDLINICDVRVFYRSSGEYGISTISKNIKKQRAINDKELYDTIVRVHSEKPIDILFGQLWSDFISAETLIKVKALGIIVINVSMDDKIPKMWRGKNHGSAGLRAGVDLILTTVNECCQWYFTKGLPAIYWPLASNPNFYFESRKRDGGIVFIGNNYGYRSKIINKLIKEGIDIQAYGIGWPNGWISTLQAAKILSSAKIAIGVGTVGHTKNLLTMKLRDFDAPTSGVLYITQYNPELINFYREDEEIVFYKTIPELIEKTKYFFFNDNEREKISQAGRLKSIEKHTWDNRFKKLIDLISNLDNT